jgi:hypothetical protein
MGDAFSAEGEIRNHGDDVDPEFMVMALIPQLPVDATRASDERGEGEAEKEPRSITCIT